MVPHCDLKSLAMEVCQIARRAGEAILTVYRQDFSVSRKRDFSPVTEADMIAHHAIIKCLDALTPSIPVLSEEGESVPYSERYEWDELWLIDPLDGTREFIKRNGEFTVNISLVQRGKPVLGVIYAPVSDDCYSAFSHGGAYRQSKTGGMTQIKCRSWNGKHITVASSRSRTENFQHFLAGFDSYETIVLGSALKSCIVAEGRADIYARFGPTSEWDTAAAQCIVEEAGGCLMSLDGEPLLYNQRESLLNPSFMVVGDKGHDWRSFLPFSLIR